MKSLYLKSHDFIRFNSKLYKLLILNSTCKLLYISEKKILYDILYTSLD